MNGVTHPHGRSDLPKENQQAGFNLENAVGFTTIPC